MDLTWTVERDAGVSLVRCRVHNDGTVRRRVRIENRLDGPVLPPRRSEIPEAGWDASGVTLRLEPDGRRAIGFAVPAVTSPSPATDPRSSPPVDPSSPPADPPVAVVESTAVESAAGDASAARDGADSMAGTRSESTVAGALRELADHRPPRAAVDGDAVVDSAGTADRGTDEGDTDGGDTTESDATGSGTETGGGPEEQRSRARTAVASPGGDALNEWFEAAERRVERAERLTDADLATATAVVETVGGVDGVAALDDRLDADAERLRELSERASSLAARAEAADAPVETLERLA